jgi:hypothetical protein
MGPMQNRNVWYTERTREGEVARTSVAGAFRFGHHLRGPRLGLNRLE